MNKELPKTKIAKIIAKESSNLEEFEASLESELEFFTKKESVELLDKEDKKLLTKLFVRLGENQLKAKNKKFLESFEMAAKVAEDQYLALYDLGTTCSKYRKQEQVLICAKNFFEKALAVQPDSFNALYAVAHTMIQIGLILEESYFFQDAIEYFKKAVMFISECSTKAEFYRDFGEAWFYLGKLSGEAIDFKNAIDCYSKSSFYGMQSSSFWNSYGDAVSELAFLVGKKEYFFEAIEFYQKSVLCLENQFHGHFNLACAFQCIFEITCDFDYFEKANECFKKAAKHKLRAKKFKVALWLKWGQLLATLGKLKREIAALEQSLEKFMEADRLEPDHPSILSRWGEAEMLLGANTDNIHYLRQAEEKFVRSLRIHPQGSEVWYLYGICLNELGRYFADVNFYKSAIDKFQYGLSLNQTDPLLWYGLAMSYFSFGEMKDNSQMIEKSLRYYAQVLEFGGHIFLQFWNDWAVALMRLAEMTSNYNYLESALLRFEELLRRQNESGGGEELDLEWLYNYACALDMHGDCTGNQHSYEKSIQILANVVKIDPEYTHARYNLALALSHLGESASDLELLQKAAEHFEILLAQENEDEIALHDWGICLLYQAELIDESCHPDVQKAIYEQAESKFLQAISLGSVSAYYSLACLYALNYNFKAAMHYIEKAEANGSLPPVDDLLHDEWLINLKNVEAFKVFISTLSQKRRH